MFSRLRSIPFIRLDWTTEQLSLRYNVCHSALFGSVNDPTLALREIRAKLKESFRHRKIGDSDSLMGDLYRFVSTHTPKKLSLTRILNFVLT